MALIVHTAPSEEPISLEETKAHLRITHNEQDSLISALIVASREWFEEYTGRSIIDRTYEWTLDGFEPVLFVPRPPLKSVESIVYLDASGVQRTLPNGAYAVDSRSQPGRITQASGQEWPDTNGSVNAVTIRFVSGYGDQSAVPQSIKAALKLWVQGEYDQDDDARRSAVALADIHRVHYRIKNI